MISPDTEDVYLSVGVCGVAQTDGITADMVVLIPSIPAVIPGWELALIPRDIQAGTILYDLCSLWIYKFHIKAVGQIFFCENTFLFLLNNLLFLNYDVTGHFDESWSKCGFIFLKTKFSFFWSFCKKWETHDTASSFRSFYKYLL